MARGSNVKEMSVGLAVIMFWLPAHQAVMAKFHVMCPEFCVQFDMNTQTSGNDLCLSK